MDLTPLFKASVKTVRLRNKSITLPDKSRILKLKPRDEFMIKANDVRFQVTQLRDLLIENRAAYMRFGYHLKTFAQMSDEERDIIDQESEKIITICNQYLTDLKAECLKAKSGAMKRQLLEHKLGVLEILSDYLKAVFRIHNEQKASRVQHELDTYKLLKLESNKKLIPVMAPHERDKSSRSFTKYLQSNDMRDHSSDQENSVDDVDDDDDGNVHRYADKKRSAMRTSNGTTQSDIAIDEDQANKYALEEEHLNADDIQMFESENVQLLNDLKGLSDEVEQIEKNVVGIARLQEIFTEKVNQSIQNSFEIVHMIFMTALLFQVTIQKTDIERIVTTVVGATENIKDANEQIKQAIQRNAGLRVWVLFFLIVMSFTLLFLDWYND